MKKLSTLLFALIVSILLPSNILASEENTTDPDAAIKEILDLRVNNEMESYAKRVIDERYTKEEEKTSEYLDGSLNGDPLVSYEVIEKNIVNSKKVVYTVRMDYESGFVYENKVNLETFKGEWYIKILAKHLEDNVDFKVVKKSKEVKQLIEKENTEKQSYDEYEIGIMSGILLKSFYGSFDYSIDTSNFYISGSSLILGINEQTLDSGTNMWYRLYKDTLDGWLKAAEKRVYNNVTSSQNYRTSFTANVSGQTKVFLRIDGDGYTRGGIYY
ncbi:hypothetical protein [Sutcliffiella horikoshii]|uniref:hypothetical protein n=1 Tax=Sutcliffiella horikoshii TaxID=79883 RepID=UPI003CEC2F8C